MRSFAFVSMLAVLSGCAQVFEGNLFENIDPPPPLSASAMADASLEDIQNQLADPNSASAFFEQLQDNPNALEALQDNLNDQIAAAVVAGDDTETVAAAQTLVLVTAYGTQTSETVNAAIQQASNLQSGGTPADAIKALMAGKTKAEIKAQLTQFQTMQTAFKAMQDAVTIVATNTVDPDIFYGAASGAAQGDLAQIALVSATADAMIRDEVAAAGTIDSLAQAIFDGTFDNTGSHAFIDKVSDALDGTDVATNTNVNYAYLSAVTEIVPF